MISGVLLAAGQSRRMGSSKQALIVGGKSFLRLAAECALASRLDEVIVVLGHNAAGLRSGLDNLPVRIVVNERYDSGQSTSLHAGLAAVDPTAEAVVVLLVDQPLMDPGVIDTLLDYFHAHGNPVVVPVWHGRRGNPVLFARELFPELLATEGDKGGRDVLRAHANKVGHVPVDTPAVVLDVDTPEDYEQLLRSETSEPS
ncbi:MAG: nucleotidyltransferase family protein [Chloroflexota bacterium]|nr:MAG: nucleotidyltransferase family protein [Chloroflexota bacterium]